MSEVVEQPAYICKKTSVERYDLRGPHHKWATITVSEDIGLLQIASDFGDWSYRWIAPGCPFKKFLVALAHDEDYFVKKITGGATELDREATEKAIHDCIREKLDEGAITEEERLEISEEVEELDYTNVEVLCAGMYRNSLLMEKLFDDDCYRAGEVIRTVRPVLAVRFFREIYVPWFVPEIQKELS